ncbi:MAG: restriction endonuclease subunit S [Lachnospiraceae bacterium]|nr:restriction endonuclease subunit S [Lachnospiraceae bacterium]
MDVDKPRIRFKGYTDAWEQCKLGEIAEIVGGGTPNTNVDAYWDGDIDWYAPAEIGEQIYLKSSQRKITKEGLNKSSAKILPIGAVLFTSRAGIGKTAILTHEGCTNQGFQSIVPQKDKLDSYFIFSRSEELKRYGETVGAGSTFVEVSGKQMANMYLMMPKTMEEQQIIGAYFARLDHLITLHQRKCDETKKLKKYMLQKMFPQNGANVPEIRFDGFTDAWEQRKLNDISEIVTGTTPPTKEKNNYGGVKLFVSPADIQSNRYVNNTITTLTDKGFDLGRKLRPGTSLFVSIGSTIGKVAQIKDFATTNQQINAVIPFEFMDDDYIFSMLEKEATTIKRLSAQQAVPIINKRTFGEIEIMYPSKEEQKKIGRYFTELDHLITLHQRKCNGLKKIRKFMLQNMFV